MKVMKKYMIMCMAVVALLLASCKNEDISISREVSFDVNPYGVIRGFSTYEVTSGDLASMYSGDKLRVNLLVYDEKGDLVASDTQLFDSYSSTMNYTTELSDGNYTVIAISEVKDRRGEDNDCWKITGTNRLDDIKITDQGYIGTKAKMLGIGHESITVCSGQTTHSIAMEPAGSLLIVNDNYIHYWSDVIRYLILTDKSSNSCTFNMDGTFNTFVDESPLSYDWIQHSISPNNEHPGDLYYSYHFVLPLGNTNVAWVADAYDEEGNLERLLLNDPISYDVKSGRVYQFDCSYPSLAWTVTELSGAKGVPSNGKDLSLNGKQERIPNKLREGFAK